MKNRNIQFALGGWHSGPMNSSHCHQQFDEVLATLAFVNIRVAVLICDGATENETFTKRRLKGGIKASHWIPDLHGADDCIVAYGNQFFPDSWIFINQDNVLGFKKLRSSLEKSGDGFSHPPHA